MGYYGIRSTCGDIASTYFTVADSGFPRRGRQPQNGYVGILFDEVFAENCMKNKEIGLRDVVCP